MRIAIFEVMKITIEPYSPDWKIAFEIEAALLYDAINEPDMVIEHVGSTAVEGLGAKPVIDIMIGLQDFNTADEHIDSIINLGYKYVSVYEDVMPFRRFFPKDLDNVRTHQIHMVEINTEFWKRHILFRDQLRNNYDYRDQYYELKLELSKKEWKDGDEYAKAKTVFIKHIEGLT